MSADDARVIKSGRKARKRKARVEVAREIQPGPEEQEQFYEAARQSGDALTDEPTPEDHGAAVEAKLGREEPLDQLGGLLDQLQRLRPPRTAAQFQFVHDSEIDEHNKAVTELNADVEDAVARDPKERLVAFRDTEWRPYKAEWEQWVQDHTGTLSRFDDAGFARLRMIYGDMRAKWLKLGQQTEAPEGSAGSPPGSGPLDPAMRAVGDAASMAVTALLAVGGLIVLSNLMKGRQ